VDLTLGPSELGEDCVIHSTLKNSILRGDAKHYLQPIDTAIFLGGAIREITYLKYPNFWGRLLRPSL